ncbi:MAG TPA: hypothetical protein VGD69_17070 [Herpetosiphonaceae bacterium]
MLLERRVVVRRWRVGRGSAPAALSPLLSALGSGAGRVFSALERRGSALDVERLPSLLGVVVRRVRVAPPDVPVVPVVPVVGRRVRTTVTGTIGVSCDMLLGAGAAGVGVGAGAGAGSLAERTS